MWKSQGCIVVNGVPREVPRPKPEGAAGSKGFWPRDFLRDSIHHDTPKAFPQNFTLYSYRISKEGFIFPMVSLGTPLEKWRRHEALSISRVKCQYCGPGCRKNGKELIQSEQSITCSNAVQHNSHIRPAVVNFA